MKRSEFKRCRLHGNETYGNDYMFCKDCGCEIIEDGAPKIPIYFKSETVILCNVCHYRLED